MNYKRKDRIIELVEEYTSCHEELDISRYAEMILTIARSNYYCPECEVGYIEIPQYRECDFCGRYLDYLEGQE